MGGGRGFKFYRLPVLIGCGGRTPELPLGGSKLRPLPVLKLRLGRANHAAGGLAKSGPDPGLPAFLGLDRNSTFDSSASPTTWEA